MKRKVERYRNPPKGWTDLSDFKDINSGSKCFVVGAGPSLAFLDISPIHDHVVIAVNSSALLMPWNQEGDLSKRFWISNDVLCMRWDYFDTHVKTACCTKLIRTSWYKNHDQLKGHNFRYFSPRHTGVPAKTRPVKQLDPDDPGLCSVSSVPAAVDFAVLMGCKQVYLLGADHKMVHGNSHFWQFWDKSKWPQRKDKEKFFKPEKKHQVRVFDQNVRVFKALKKFASSKGTSIYNCSSRSALDLFKKIPFEEAFDVD